MPREQFTVYVVESPSPHDLYHSTNEGTMLLAALKLARIPAFHTIAVNRVTLLDALSKGFIAAVRGGLLRPPVLHLSAHGDENGIQLTSGEVIEWWELADVLRIQNDTVHGQLVVAMSSCHGLHGVKMATNLEKLPFAALIGSENKPTWPETAIGFAALYHNLAECSDLDETLEAMKIASRHDGFAWFGGEAAREQYKSALDRIKQEQAVLGPTSPEAAQQGAAADPPIVLATIPIRHFHP